MIEGEKKTKERKEERKNNQNKLAELIGGDLSEKQDRSEFPWNTILERINNKIEIKKQNKIFNFVSFHLVTLQNIFFYLHIIFQLLYTFWISIPIAAKFIHAHILNVHRNKTNKQLYPELETLNFVSYLTTSQMALTIKPLPSKELQYCNPNSKTIHGIISQNSDEKETS